MYKLTEQNNTTFIYLTDSEFQELADKLQEINLIDVSPGGTYYVYEVYEGTSVNPTTPGYNDIISRSSIKKYFKSNTLEFSPSIYDFWDDEINLILTAIIIGGIVVGLVGWGWALLLIALLIIIIYNALKKTWNDFFNNLKDEFEKNAPEWLKKLLKELPLAFIVLVVLIILAIFYISRNLL